MAILNISDFQQIKSKALEIQTISEDINTLLNNLSVELHEKIGENGTEWQGNNAIGFMQQFDGLKPSFDKVYLAIRSMGEAIESTGTMFANTEGVNDSTIE